MVLQRQRLPQWLVKKCGGSEKIHDMRAMLRGHKLHTVCEEAKCPNMGECFCSGTATFMIMGDVCTRSCKFCAVAHGKPKPLDSNEPSEIAKMCKELGLKYAVITSVTRDDLKDYGASHFVAVVNAVRAGSPNIKIEILTPDFGGNKDLIKLVCDARPDIFNHNIETVKRLSEDIRCKATYDRSLNVLQTAANFLKPEVVKSGLMVGMGETKEEVLQTLKDLYDAGCRIVTIGQYLAPSKASWPVAEYIEPKVFDEYKVFAEKIGFRYVFSGPLVRSSYMAHTVFETRNTKYEIRNKPEIRIPKFET